jgi:hypothetical protein
VNRRRRRCWGKKRWCGADAPSRCHALGDWAVCFRCSPHLQRTLVRVPFYRCCDGAWCHLIKGIAKVDLVLVAKPMGDQLQHSPLWSSWINIELKTWNSNQTEYPFLDRLVYRACCIMIVSYALSYINDYNTLFHFGIESHTDFGPSISKDHRLYHKTHIDCVFSERTGWSAFS